MTLDGATGGCCRQVKVSGFTEWKAEMQPLDGIYTFGGFKVQALGDDPIRDTADLLPENNVMSRALYQKRAGGQAIY